MEQNSTAGQTTDRLQTGHRQAYGTCALHAGSLRLQTQWEETTTGADTKGFLAKCRKTTGSEFTLKPKCNNNYEWTWKYPILPTPIKNHRQSRVSMQTKHTNSRPFDISV